MKMKDIEIGKTYASYSNDSTGYSKRNAKQVTVLDKGYDKGCGYGSRHSKRDGGLFVKVRVGGSHEDYLTASQIREPWDEYDAWERADRKARSEKVHQDNLARKANEAIAEKAEAALKERGISGFYFRADAESATFRLNAKDVLKLLGIE